MNMMIDIIMPNVGLYTGIVLIFVGCTMAIAVGLITWVLVLKTRSENKNIGNEQEKKKVFTKRGKITVIVMAVLSAICIIGGIILGYNSYMKEKRYHEHFHGRYREAMAVNVAEDHNTWQITLL